MQCPHCGQETKNEIKCDRCSYVLNKKKKRKSYVVNTPQCTIGSIAQPPRNVPKMLILASFSLYRAIILSSIILFVLIHLKNFQIIPTKNWYIITVGSFSLLFLYIVALTIKKITLLRHGVVASVQVLERRPWRKAYATAPIAVSNGSAYGSQATVYKHWGTKRVPVGDAKYLHKMKLTGTNGKSHTFRWLGYKYIGEYYLFDPENPRKRLRQSAYHITLTPKDGNWYCWPRDRFEFFVRIAVITVLSALCVGTATIW